MTENITTTPLLSVTFFIGLSAWLLVGIGVGRAVGRSHNSVRLGWLVGAVLFAVPIWDLPLGLAMYSKYVKELAGTRTFKTAQVDGYLDLTDSGTIDNSTLGSLLVSFANARRSPEAFARRPYRYIEVRHDFGSQTGDFIQQPGYWQISIAKRGDPQCEPFEAWATKRTSGPTYRELNPVIENWCAVAIRHDRPVSRYRLEFSGNKLVALPGPRWLPPVLAQWTRVVDQSTGEVLGQSTGSSTRVGCPFPVSVPGAG